MWEEGWGPECKPWDKGAEMDNDEIDLEARTTVVQLGNHDGPLLSYVWAHMAKLALTELVIHQGDLFHDAVKLEKEWELRGRHLEMMDFYFGYSDAGTSFIMPEHWEGMRTAQRVWWHVLITTKDRNKSAWVAHFARITD